MEPPKRRLPDHGTRRRYQSGCRCEACRAANTGYLRNRNAGLATPGRPVERLLATCWCEEFLVWLPVAMVRACRTVSCGAPDCREAA